MQSDIITIDNSSSSSSNISSDVLLNSRINEIYNQYMLLQEKIIEINKESKKKDLEIEKLTKQKQQLQDLRFDELFQENQELKLASLKQLETYIEGIFNIIPLWSFIRENHHISIIFKKFILPLAYIFQLFALKIKVRIMELFILNIISILFFVYYINYYFDVSISCILT